MRILVLSNYYPPHVQGGYELRCSETAAELVKRGHEVAVLTSRDNTRPTKTRLDGVEVHYGLHLEADPRPLRTALRFFLRRKRNEIGNQLLVEDVIAELRPDIVFIWGMWNVPRCVPYMAERLCPGRVVYHLSDYWSALPSAYCQYWEKSSGRRLSALPKRLIARPVLARLAQAEELHLRFQHPTCVSQAVKDNLVKAGVPIAHAAVLHSGIKRRIEKRNHQKRVLYGIVFVVVWRRRVGAAVYWIYQSSGKYWCSEMDNGNVFLVYHAPRQVHVY